jgi:hypothetical protein
MPEPVELDLATLNVVLGRIRRHPHHLASRRTADEQLSFVVDHASTDQDQLLKEIVAMARLLRRALNRGSTTDLVGAADLASMNAWIDKLQVLLERAIAR